MAVSRCGKCDSTSFEVEAKKPAKSNYELMFVQCARCGNPFGVLESHNINHKISELQNELNSKIASLESYIGTVNQNVGTIINKLDKLEK
jgi:ribosomal protein S27AE